MKKYFLLLICFFIAFGNVQAKKIKTPFKCGFGVKDKAQMDKNYVEYNSNFEVKKGEKVASVGAGSGSIEVQISHYVDSVEWTLEDINQSCLSYSELNKVLGYYENIQQKKVNASFKLLIGTETATTLPRNYFDRIILSNVYHELSDRKSMLTDILGALNENGCLVIMERMSAKPGKKHGDCHHLKLMESELLSELQSFGFKLRKKVAINKRHNISYYTFIKQR